MPDCFCALGLAEQVGSCSGGQHSVPGSVSPHQPGSAVPPHPGTSAPAPAGRGRCAQGPGRDIQGSVLSLGPFSLWSPLRADKRVWVQSPPLSPVLAPQCFHPPHQGGQGAPRGLREHLTWAPVPGTSPAHPRAERSLPHQALGRAADLCPLSGAGDESPTLRGRLRCCLEQPLLSRPSEGQEPVPAAPGAAFQGCVCEAGDGSMSVLSSPGAVQGGAGGGPGS